MLDQLGPAIISQNSIFVYGPTATEKPASPSACCGCIDDAVLIPYAVEVDGQVISLYDPVVHQPLEMDDDSDIDPRWLLCKRPCIVVGGELIPSMLELRLDEASGIYAAPLQMKANNGILIIDDFGRQLMSPRDLLNRWIVPLDRRVDYLTLRYGVKFQIPFELMVVFSTNLDPVRPGRRSLPAPHSQQDLRRSGGRRRSFDQIFTRVVRPAHSGRARQRRISAQAVPARRPHRTARLLSGRHLQHSAVHRPL
jgi:predicted ATPase with chaperone activity